MWLDVISEHWVWLHLDVNIGRMFDRCKCAFCLDLSLHCRDCPINIVVQDHTTLLHLLLRQELYGPPHMHQHLLIDRRRLCLVFLLLFQLRSMCYEFCMQAGHYWLNIVVLRLLSTEADELLLRLHLRWQCLFLHRSLRLCHTIQGHSEVGLAWWRSDFTLYQTRHVRGLNTLLAFHH